jgi:hypothetical protein
MGGILWGPHAAAPNIEPQISALLRVDLMEIALRIIGHHGTQNRPQRDPQGCDVSHDLIMFLLV